MLENRQEVSTIPEVKPLWLLMALLSRVTVQSVPQEHSLPMLAEGMHLLESSASAQDFVHSRHLSLVILIYLCNVFILSVLLSSCLQNYVLHKGRNLSQNIYVY